MQIRNSSFEKIFPIILLILGIIGVYLGNALVVFVLFVLALLKWTLETEVTKQIYRVAPKKSTLKSEVSDLIDMILVYLICTWFIVILTTIFPIIIAAMLYMLWLVFILNRIWQNQKELKIISERDI